MAKQTLSIVSSFQPQNLAQELANQTSRLAPLLSRLRIEAGSGINCAWVNQFSAKSVYTPDVDGYAVQSSEYTSDAKVIATLNWSAMRSAFELTSAAQDVSASTNGGASELKNLFAHELKSASSKLAASINAKLHSGTGANRSLVGLTSALIASSTYAGIDVGVYTEFAATVNDNSGSPRSLTSALMSTTLKNLRVASASVPDLIVMHPGMLDKYSALFDKRQYHNQVNEFDLGINPRLLSFQGIPIMEDRDCSTTRVKFLSMDSMCLRVLPPVVSDSAVFFRMGQASANNLGQSQATGLPLIVEPIAKDGPSDKYSVRTPEFQLVIKHPSMNAILSDLS